MGGLAGHRRDALIDETLRRVAERTKVDDAAGATRAAEAGFAQWEKEESARRTSAARQQGSSNRDLEGPRSGLCMIFG